MMMSLLKSVRRAAITAVALFVISGTPSLTYAAPVTMFDVTVTSTAPKNAHFLDTFVILDWSGAPAGDGIGAIAEFPNFSGGAITNKSVQFALPFPIASARVAVIGLEGAHVFIALDGSVSAVGSSWDALFPDTPEAAMIAILQNVDPSTNSKYRTAFLGFLHEYASDFITIPNGSTTTANIIEFSNGVQTGSIAVNLSTAPEPSMAFLMIIGVAGLWGVRRFSRN